MGQNWAGKLSCRVEGSWVAVPKRNRAGGYKYMKQWRNSGGGLWRNWAWGPKKKQKKWVGRLGEARGWTRVRLLSKLEGHQAGR